MIIASVRAQQAFAFETFFKTGESVIATQKAAVGGIFCPELHNSDVIRNKHKNSQINHFLKNRFKSKKPGVYTVLRHDNWLYVKDYRMW